MTSRPLHVATYRNPAGERLVLHADFDPDRLARNVRFALQCHRLAAGLRLHRIVGMRCYPVDFASVVTVTYEPLNGPSVPTEPATETEERPYDLWADFNDIHSDGTVVTYVNIDGKDDRDVDVSVGTVVTAGDGEGNRCPATVVEVDGSRIVLRLHDQFQSAGPDGGKEQHP